uniref:Uncharacterized protein n=1 Tax=Acrobeloides nanus TaxID=290746 RepID=A0A914CXX1_9BILA
MAGKFTFNLLENEMELLIHPNVTFATKELNNRSNSSSDRGNVILTNLRIIFLPNPRNSPSRSYITSLWLVNTQNFVFKKPFFINDNLNGVTRASNDSQWQGDLEWKLTFHQSRGIDFAQAVREVGELNQHYNHNIPMGELAYLADKFQHRNYSEEVSYGAPSGGCFCFPCICLPIMF